LVFKAAVLTFVTTAAMACALDFCQTIDAVRFFVAGVIFAILCTSN
jgi:hypothetical protein